MQVCLIPFFLPSYPFRFHVIYSSHHPLISFNNSQHPTGVDNDLVYIASAYPADRAGTGGEARKYASLHLVFWCWVLGFGMRVSPSLWMADLRRTEDASRFCFVEDVTSSLGYSGLACRFGVRVVASVTFNAHIICTTYPRINFIYMSIVRLSVELRRT